MRPLFKSTLSFTLIAAIFFFLGKKLYLSYNEIGGMEFSINWSLALISFIFPILFFLIMGHLWKLCLGLFGPNIRSFRGIYYWCKSQLGKYLPGTIWYVIGRVHFLSKHNVHKQDSIASMIIEIIFLAEGSLLIALFFLNIKISNIISIYLALIFAIIGLVTIHPKLLNFVISKFKKLNIRLKKDYNYIIILFVFYFLTFLIASFGFYLFSISIYSGLNIYYAIGCFGLAYFLGLIVIFAPGGLGVREGVLSLMLSVVMPMPIAIIIAFAARIWWTLAELSSIAISWYLMKLARH